RTSPARAGRCTCSSSEPVEERRLGGVDALAGLGEREPLGAVDLRELAAAAGAGRPFQLERVGVKAGRVEVALQRPRLDDLAGLLAPAAQAGQRTGRRGAPRLPLEL